MCAPVTTVMLFISTLLPTGALSAAVDCSSIFVIDHNSSVWKKISQDCEDTWKLEYCQEIGELELDSQDNETVQPSFTACTEAEYLVYYDDLSNNSCRIDHVRDNISLTPNGNESIYLFQNCSGDDQHINRTIYTTGTMDSGQLDLTLLYYVASWMKKGTSVLEHKK